MFLTVLDPHGGVASIALTDLPGWQLELRAIKYHQPKPETEDQLDHPRTLALCVTFVVGGAKAYQPIAAIDLVSPSGEVGTIAAEGIQGGTPAAQKAWLRDKLGMLHNGATIPATQVDELIAEASTLADIYSTIIKALWATPSSIDSAAALVKGEFNGWRYAITRTRFEAVFTPSLSSAEGIGIPPGMGLGDRPPPPVAKGTSRRQPPVLTSANAPSAEAQAAATEPPPGGGSVAAPLEAPPGT